MRNCLKVLALVVAIAFVQGCGPVDNLGSQGGDIGKNIVISPDSTVDCDPALVKSLITSAIDAKEWSSLGANCQSDTEIFVTAHHVDNWGVTGMKLVHDGAKVISVDADVFAPPAVAASNFYPSCPDASRETYWTTECTTINTATAVINTNHSAAQTRGYNSAKGLGSQESKANVYNNLSCANMRLWGRVGHGYTAGLQLANHESLSNFSGVNLSGKGIYANSCQAFNNPFKGQVTGAGAQWFISGITNLSIGPSEKTFECWWGKAKNQAEICGTLNGCVQSGAGQHGCHGQGSTVPAPGGGPNPTPTPGPNPTPTPGPNPTPTPGDSCQGMCGKKSGSCWCDNLCKQYGDCCADYDQFCGPNPTPQPTPNPTPPPTPHPGPNTSVGKCGGQASGGCWCDNYCKMYGDCCADFDQVC